MQQKVFSVDTSNASKDGMIITVTIIKLFMGGRQET